MVYDFPEYYEIAFSFRDVRKEVDFFEEAMKRYSSLPLRGVLELASGPSPHLEEWHRRGVRYHGIDTNSNMLRYARERAKRSGIGAEFRRGNVRSADLGRNRIDFAYVMLGSLYVRSNDEFLEHLGRVATVLRRDALYLIDGFVWFDVFKHSHQSWTMRRGGIRVKTLYQTTTADAVEQTYHEHLTLRVTDRGRKHMLKAEERRKAFFPQEFLALVRAQKRFEFVGWFNNFHFRERPRPSGRQAVLLRKVR